MEKEKKWANPVGNLQLELGEIVKQQKIKKEGIIQEARLSSVGGGLFTLICC